MQERWERAIAADAGDASSRALGLLLRLGVWPYLAGLRANLALYDSGLRARTGAALPVVSVGNLTLGGTGKTTTTRALARALMQRGVRPGLVLRGHRRRRARGPLLVADRHGLLSGVEQAGDEATMLALTVPGCPVAVGKRRERVIDLLADAGAQVALLDDGFQYFRMARLADLVLLDATVDLQRARLFPAGYLREPLSHLRRATHVLVTHADLAPAAHVEQLVATARRWAPHAPVMQCRHRPTTVYPLSDPAAERPAEELGGKRVLALSALGNPAAFEATLLGLGADVADRVALDDHHHYVPEDYRLVHQLARAGDADFIVVTEKDAVKLPPPRPGMPPVHALKVDLEITEGVEHWEALLDMVQDATNPERTGQAD